MFFFLLVALRRNLDAAFARRVMAVVAGISGIYAFLSVEAVSTGFSLPLLRCLAVDTEKIYFANSRLSGIFGNSNIESSIYAVGIFCAVALACGAEKKGRRALWAVVAAVNALAFLLVFSMGAIACFIAAVAVYLVFAGKGRAAAV